MVVLPVVSRRLWLFSYIMVQLFSIFIVARQHESRRPARRTLETASSAHCPQSNAG